MQYFIQPQTPMGCPQEQGLGSWFSRAVSNVGKFIQQTDLVSHAASELGVGKTTVGKILVPTASDNIDKHQTIVKKDMPKPVWTVNAENCAVKYAKDPKCIAFNNAKIAVESSQQIIDVPVEKVSHKTLYIVGGALVIAGGLIFLARRRKKKKAALSGVKQKRTSKRRKSK